MKIINNDLLFTIQKRNVSVKINNQTYYFIYEKYLEDISDPNIELIKILDENDKPIDFDTILDDDQTFEDFFYENIIPNLNI